MAVVKKINDSIRVKILSAMTKKGAVQPNVRQIKKITGLHRATIKSSIDFLEKEEFITGYRPLLDPLIAGYNLKSYSFYQLDLSLKEKINSFKDLLKKDKNIIYSSSTISDGNYNFFINSISKNIEEFHNNLKNNYVYKLPSYYDLIKKSVHFYSANPLYKNKNQIDVIIDLLLKEQGLD